MFLDEFTGTNQAVTPYSSSGHELYIGFRFSGGSSDARVKFMVTADKGRCFCGNYSEVVKSAIACH